MTRHLPPKKSLGQNFLQDPNTIRKIVGSVEAPANARVVEIGPGTGALTHGLAERYEHLSVIEIDERAVAILREVHPDLDVIQMDVREVNWAAFAEGTASGLYLIGNLPYYLTSTILFSVLAASTSVTRAVFMMQREVAERIAASNGNKTYGILSVLSQLYADVDVLFDVSPNVFYPRPKVWSSVVSFRFKKPSEAPSESFEDIKTVVKTAFNQRRKTLKNSLRNLGDVPEQFAHLRAEALSPDDFVVLTRTLFNNNADPR